MTTSPLVTIALTAYERADLFRICLLSICRQSYRNLEIYVLDNSNSDAVQNCVEEIADSRIRYSRNDANIRDNIVVNHQKAFQPRNGAYHFVMSSDWALNEKTIELMVAALASDTMICAVAADGCKVDVETGARTPRNRRLPAYGMEGSPGPHERIDTRRLINDAFSSATGVGVAYHTLMVSDILTYANLERMYLSQTHEHQMGLEILMQKPAFGLIRQDLLETLVNDRRYQVDVFRQYRRFMQATARLQFLEKNRPTLLSRGFNVIRMQLGLIRQFAKCTCHLDEHPFDAACYVARLSLPMIVATFFAPLYLAIGLVRSLIGTRAATGSD
jgi:hypothetical protein